MIDNICIIVCFYNTNPKYLEECFISIDNAIWFFKRYYNIPINVHVMDDGSDNPDTISMFNNIIQKYKYIKLWRHDNNTTLATAINDLNEHTPEHALVIYIDSDDMMMYNRILVQYEIFTKYDNWKNISFCATTTVTPNIHINRATCYKYFSYSLFNKIECFRDNIIIHPTIAYKIDDIRKYNIKYDDNFKCIQDFDFYLNILKHKLIILLIPDALTYYREYDDTEKPDSNRDYQGELEKLKFKYNNQELNL